MTDGTVACCVQFCVLPYQSIQTSLFRDADEHQVRDAHGSQEPKHATCAGADLYQSLRRIWYVMEGIYLNAPDWNLSTVVKNPLSPVEHPGGVGVNNELFEESLEQFVVCNNLRYWVCCF